MNLHLISTFVLVTHWLIVIGLSVRVIMRRPPVGVSVAWLAVIFSLPFVGAGVYLLFGEKRLGRRRASRIATTVDNMKQWQIGLRQQSNAVASPIEATSAPLDRYAERVLGFPALPGNEIELLDSFESVFDAIVADIDGAQSKADLPIVAIMPASR